MARTLQGPVLTSKVKWFNNKLGFGFILDPNSGPDIFVHYTNILDKGYRTLKEGEKVTFVLLNGKNGPKAEQVQRKQSRRQ